MSFWNNPENNSVKVLVIVIVIAVIGLFVFDFMHKGTPGDTGRVISTTAVSATGSATAPTASPSKAVPVTACTFQVCSAGGKCVDLQGQLAISSSSATNSATVPASCIPNDQQSSPAAQGVMNILNAQQ